jgi:hypothetical protein
MRPGEPAGRDNPDHAEKEEPETERYSLTLGPGNSGGYSCYQSENYQHKQAFSHSLYLSSASLFGRPPGIKWPWGF